VVVTALHIFVGKHTGNLFFDFGRFLS